jgi:ribosomal protein L20A (L18A)
MPINPNYNFLNVDASLDDKNQFLDFLQRDAQAKGMGSNYVGDLRNTQETMNVLGQQQAPRPAQPMQAPRPNIGMQQVRNMPEMAPTPMPEIPEQPEQAPAPMSAAQGMQGIGNFEELPMGGTNILPPEEPMQTRILPPQEPALPQGFENTEIAKRGQAMGMDPRQILVALAELSAGMGNLKGKPQQSTARSFYEMQKKYEQQNRQNALGDLKIAQRMQPKTAAPVDPLTQQYKQMQIDYLKSKMQPKPAEAPRQVDSLSEDYKRAQIENLRARTKAMGSDGQLPVSVGGTDQTSPKAVRLASDLRKEYQNNAVTKTSRDVKTQWAKVKEVMDNPSAAGDMAAIFMFMKTLDPGSTVREGEYKSAAEATSALGRVQTSLLQAKSGDKLNPAQRADFRKVMEKFYRAQMKEQARVNKQYSDLAGRQGINPADLMIEDVDSVQSEPGTPRKVRSVNDLPDVR